MESKASDRPVAAVGVVCLKGDDVLLIRRGTAPLRGHWSLPGGRVEPGERLKAAALRELHEETGITARLTGFIEPVDAIFHSRTTGDTTRHYLLFDYAARWVSGTPLAGDDADHAEWIAQDKLRHLELWSETRRIIEAALALDAAAAPD